MSTKLIIQVCIKMSNTHKKPFTCGFKNVTQLAEHMPGGAAAASEKSGLEPWFSGLLRHNITHKPSLSTMTEWAAVLTPLTALLRTGWQDLPSVFWVA